MKRSVTLNLRDLFEAVNEYVLKHDLIKIEKGDTGLISVKVDKLAKNKDEKIIVTFIVGEE